jgi:hypothetical protein
MLIHIRAIGFGQNDSTVKVDNVVCRTPTRNAHCLETVKNEIFEIVDRDDSDFTSQVVNVDRLWHRKLKVRVKDLAELENEFHCKIEFPNTEQASDEVKISGPQWQVPRCVDGFLVSLWFRRTRSPKLEFYDPEN